jgi:hypothetical protein
LYAPKDPGDAALEASELHDALLGQVDRDRYFEELYGPDEQAARAKRHAERDAIIAASPVRVEDPQQRGKNIRARHDALAGLYASQHERERGEEIAKW